MESAADPKCGDKSGSEPATVTVTATIPATLFETLKRLAEEEGVSMAEVLRAAIYLEKFLREEKAKGSKILIESRRGALRELIMK